MARLTIVSGSPGAGKTTLAARLAKGDAKGLHIPSDVFYTFPGNPIDPTRPESRDQNTAIIRALGAASSVFLSSGYDVYLDGIVGPWFLPTLLEEIPKEYSVDYLLLTVDTERALERVRNREGRGLSRKVKSTRSSFEETSEYDAHEFDTTGLDAEAVFGEISRRLEQGEFRLSR